MGPILLSVLVGTMGMLVTRVRVRRLAADSEPHDAYLYWVLGLAGVIAAWMVAFIALLGDSPAVRPTIASMVPWTLSAAAGLVGAIAGEARVRRASESPEGLPPAQYWRIGVWTGVPAWAIAVLGHLLRLVV